MKDILRKMIVFLWLSVMYTNANAYTIKLDSVHIGGVWKEKFKKGTKFKIKIVDPYTSPWWGAFGDSDEVELDSLGHFDIRFKADNKLFYGMLSFEDENKRPMNFANMQLVLPTFLMEKGDDLFMEVGKESVLFKGKGSARMNCQYLLNINPIYPRQLSKLLEHLQDTKQYGQELKYWQHIVEDNLKTNMGIIDAYRGYLTDSVARILRFDCIGMAYGAVYTRFKQRTSLGYDFKLYKKILDSTLMKHEYTNDELAAFSWNYMNFLYKREDVKMMYLENQHSLNMKYAFADLLDRIFKNEPGLIRDNLLVTSFLNSLDRHPDTYTFEKKVESELHSKAIREIYDRWSQNNGTLKPAYAFELPDSLGAMHRLSDFKGKILLVDFWFNGCIGCAQLTKAMTPIIQKYKGNPKIEFLSISVGASREGWIRGIRSGLYTHPGQLVLSTHGKTPLEADIVRYYNYNSFPRLLLIDQKGRILMTNAPDPRSDGGEDLIKKLDELL